MAVFSPVPHALISGLNIWSKKVRDVDGVVEYSVAVSNRLQINHGPALRVAALQGLRIVLQPAFLLEQDVRDGWLVQLLAGFALPSRPMQVVYVADRYRVPKVKRFVGFLVDWFGVAAI